ncbi:MAG: MBL fold metallo-hydrolase [Pseudomonadota bacterium]
MNIKFWGVRGSIAIPGPTTMRYGGNTPCIEVQGGQGECIILDAGTGLRSLGNDLIKRGISASGIHLFISHTHWDHIQGFSFFAPCYIPGMKINVKGPVQYHEARSLHEVFDLQMQYDFFPVSNNQLAADICYENLHETELAIGSLGIKTQFMNHSIQSLGYRLTELGKTIVYTGDHEPYYDVFNDSYDAHPSPDDVSLSEELGSIVQDATSRFIDFVRGADLFIVDCQYTPEEYPSKKRTWGHSSWDFCLDWMQLSGAGRMVLTHHDPLRTDDALDDILIRVREKARDRGINPEKIMMAREGMEIEV